MGTAAQTRKDVCLGDITFRQLLTTSTTEQESNTVLFLIYEIMHNFVFNNYYMHIVNNNTTNRGTIYPALPLFEYNVISKGDANIIGRVQCHSVDSHLKNG